ncbi:MAG: PP2C family protein-serine/threonine phosphatase, partial [Methanotrichaceae archaeon]|nr:PP2C family protein-serine/threonine phosphatase [Methanotrichaceae archaeon]
MIFGSQCRRCCHYNWHCCRHRNPYFEHKPYLTQERARIEAAGGKVLLMDIPRVQGELALSRALGYSQLKPYIIAEPRIVEGTLGRENDFAVIACDGLWNVLYQEKIPVESSSITCNIFIFLFLNL